MRRLRGVAVLAASVVVLGVAAYRILLTDEARAAIRSSAVQMRDTVETLNDKLGEKQNVDIESLPNRQRTEEMWEALGY